MNFVRDIIRAGKENWLFLKLIFKKNKSSLFCSVTSCRFSEKVVRNTPINQLLATFKVISKVKENKHFVSFFNFQLLGHCQVISFFLIAIKDSFVIQVSIMK